MHKNSCLVPLCPPLKNGNRVLYCARKKLHTHTPGTPPDTPPARVRLHTHTHKHTHTHAHFLCFCNAFFMQPKKPLAEDCMFASSSWSIFTPSLSENDLTKWKNDCKILSSDELIGISVKSKLREVWVRKYTWCLTLRLTYSNNIVKLLINSVKRLNFSVNLLLFVLLKGPNK